MISDGKRYPLVTDFLHPPGYRAVNGTARPTLRDKAHPCTNIRVGSLRWVDKCVSESRPPAQIPSLVARSLGILAMKPTEPDSMSSGRLLNPDEARRLLESRLGLLHARLRLGIEREHEAQAFGQGLNFLHLENLPLMQAIIEIGLRVTGTYLAGPSKRGQGATEAQYCESSKSADCLQWFHYLALE
jgi:hypothetical protein